MTQTICGGRAKVFGITEEETMSIAAIGGGGGYQYQPPASAVTQASTSSAPSAKVDSDGDHDGSTAVKDGRVDTKA